MPFVLDTDHISILLEDSRSADRVFDRMRRCPPDDVATSIVSFQEQMQGWMAQLARASKPDLILRAYARLDRVLRAFSRTNVIPFEEAAQARFEDLRRQTPRLGTLDLRIASIALVTDSVLVTRNLRDFRQVPGLLTEDWSR